MWSEDLDVIILAGDGDDRDGHAGHGETSKDLSTHHCEEKLFHKYILSGQARPLCLSDLLQDTPTSRGELVSHRPISHCSTCGRCSGTGTRRTTRMMIQPLMMRWTFFYVTVLLSLRPALLAHNEVVIQSQPHALPRNLDPPFRTCLKRRQTGRRLRLPPGDSTD